MGQNLARNIAHHGFPIAVHNRTDSKITAFVDEHGDEGIEGFADIADFVAALDAPRTVIVMVQAGPPVDDVISQLREHLEPGDLIIDGGNSDFRDTERRLEDLAGDDIRYLGCGVSGGEEGALNGPSLMPGGTREAYDQIAEVLTTIAAQVDGEPCCTYIGDGGAGHFVKMVHNGIEYADMQLIAEAYDLLRTGAGLTNDELADTFTEWNDGELESFLIEITARIFRRHVEATDGGEPSGDAELDEPEGWLIDVIRGAAGQKGTGRLTVTAALDVGAPATTTAEAVFARVLSSLSDERTAAAGVLPGPDAGEPVTPDDRDAFVADVRTALYASKIVAYAQGFDILQRASKEHDWDLDLGALATIWRGGCIIRAQFLNRIRESYADDPDLVNLLLATTFTDALADAQDGWRRIVAHGAHDAIPLPAFSSALAFYDGYRREWLPANLIQAQRDLFGAHTYQRTDREGSFHSEW